jgi:hypothetical protein
MSHGRERLEKDCLNCGAFVQGRFCQACGQENIEPKENFWTMVVHFFNDITHFDGKFFVTLRDLLFRPGFLSSEYMKGKRVSYLHPVRMYIFTSAIFFLIFFSIVKPKDVLKVEQDRAYTMQERDSIVNQIRVSLKKEPESLQLKAQLAILADTVREVRASDLMAKSKNSVTVGTIGGKYYSRRDYDSIQAALPPNQRDNWIKRQWNLRASATNERYRRDKSFSAATLADDILHKLPYLLFVSLPFFALLLKLLYIRRRNYFYVDHGIFSIHLYVVNFILFLLMLGFSRMEKLTGWSVWNVLIGAGCLAIFVYMNLAMKRFYRQGYLKTFFKFLLLLVFGFVMVLTLFIIFTLFAVFQL